MNLSWPKDILVNVKYYQFLQRMEIPLNQIPLMRLALPEKIVKKLHALHICSIDDLACQRQTTLAILFEERAEEIISLLAKNLNTYLMWLPNQSSWENEVSNEGISPLYTIWLKETTIEQIMDELLAKLSTERRRKIIRLRFGLGGDSVKTLREVGEQLDLTRERIRQLEKKSIKLLTQHIKINTLHALYKHIYHAIKASGGLMNIKQLGIFLESLTEMGEIDSQGSISLLLTIEPDLFFAVKKHKIWGLTEYKTLFHWVPLLQKGSQQILKDIHGSLFEVDIVNHLKQTNVLPAEEMEIAIQTQFIHACLSIDDRFEEIDNRKWQLVRRRRKRLSQVVTVLRKLGKPTHFTEITQVINQSLPPLQQVSSNSIHARLSDRSDIFVWVDAGTFGLAEWGLKKSRFYVDIAEEFLEKQGKPTDFEDIYAYIQAERENTPQNILFMLQTNPRFYRYSKTRFGLASWEEDDDLLVQDKPIEDPFFDTLKKRLGDDSVD